MQHHIAAAPTSLTIDDNCSKAGPAPASSRACCSGSGSAAAAASNRASLLLLLLLLPLSVDSSVLDMLLVLVLMLVVLVLVLVVVVPAVVVPALSAAAFAARAACTVGCRLSRKPGIGIASDTWLRCDGTAWQGRAGQVVRAEPIRSGQVRSDR